MNMQRGFTLIEIAIVLVIVTVLLGYTLAMFPVQQELKQYRQADKEMTQIIDSLYAFVQVNGYLPCPATTVSNGFECRIDTAAGVPGACDGTNPAADTCDLWFGAVPAKTLGIEGRYRPDGLLYDPWGRPYQYQVTNADSEDNDSSGTNTAGDGDGIGDMVVQGGIRNTAISNASTTTLDLFLVTPDLSVCITDPTPAAAGNDTACAAAQRIIGVSPAVILSTGKDAATIASLVQLENLDNGPTDTVFIKATRSDVNGAEYDDLVKWISPNILYSKMFESDQLP